MQIPWIDARTPAGRAVLDALIAKMSLDAGLIGGAGDKSGKSPAQSVAEIVADVRARGDPAVIEYIRKFDGVEVPASQLRVGPVELDAAHLGASPTFLAAVRRIAERIRTYQKQILYKQPADTLRDGLRSGIRVRPLRRVGVYIPGGAGAYPSTVLMTVVPAQVAGVAEICLCSPMVRPGSSGGAGEVRREVLAVARELGITEVYRIGGVQAIAAMAFGTETVPAVDKIVGPGNLYVTLAKKHVYGHVDIDVLAGPSEVLVIADKTADPDCVASDMLAQAEHDPGSALLVTPSHAVASAVLNALAAQLPKRTRKAAIEKALVEYSGLVVVESMGEAIALSNRIAPEHLSIQTAEGAKIAERCVNAGAVFVGKYSPVAFGDYTAGPSHVLPTGGTARFASGLTANSFVKTGSYVEYDAGGCAKASADALKMAQTEGFEAHGNSVEVRKK